MRALTSVVQELAEDGDGAVEDFDATAVDACVGVLSVFGCWRLQPRRGLGLLEHRQQLLELLVHLVFQCKYSREMMEKSAQWGQFGLKTLLGAHKSAAGIRYCH